VNICDIDNGRPGTWNRNGVIVFAPNWRMPLYRVNASGGTPTQVTEFDKSRSETTHRHPWFLPDGDHFLYLAGTHLADKTSDLNAIYAGSLDSKQRKLITRARSNAIYSAGYLLFVRETYLMAQRFDAKKLELVGEPVRIADNVHYDSGFFRAVFGAADDGTIVYASGGGTGTANLTWFDRTAKQLGTLGEKADAVQGIRISPDGKKAAVVLGDPNDVWIYDLQRGGRKRFTSDPLNDATPVWSPDGSRIVFSSDRNGLPELYIKSADGTASETLLYDSPENMLDPSDWSQDGRYLSFDVRNAKHTEDTEVWMMPMTGQRKPFVFLRGPFNPHGGTFSADGKWLAFISNESGRQELYVTSFPTAGPRQQISTNGTLGWSASWTTDGKEILYLGPDGTLMSIKVKTGSQFDFETAQPVMKLPRATAGDVMTDGRKFLLAIPEKAPEDSITLVTSGLPATRD
jgi:Tol biopolymer transport system component